VATALVIDLGRAMPSKLSRGLIARVIFTIVIVAVVGVISFVLLTPFLAHPPRAPILLDKTVMLTDDSYEQRYSLTFRKGEKLHIQVSGFGQPLDFKITDESFDESFVEETDISFFDGPWTVPKDGTYLFHVSAVIGDVKVRIIVSRI